MPSIISPTGRALQAELQNMPPDQVQAYLAQNVGKVPMAELLAMKMQLDRMRQAVPQQRAPQSTVAQDMQAQLQQARGISALPVQNVGQPQNYAGGGIVAFQQGGPTMYVSPEGGVSSSLPPRNLPATIGRGASAAEDPAAFWKTVTEFMKRGASQSEAIAKAETVMGSLKAGARLAGRFAGPIGLGLGSYGAVSNVADEGKRKDLLVKYLRNAGLTYDDYLNLTPESQAAFGQMVGSGLALSGMTGLNLTGEGETGGRSTSGPPTRAKVTGAGRRAELAGLSAIAPRKETTAPPAPPAPEAPAPAAAPKTIQDYLKEEAALREQLGVGTTLGEREKYIREREAKTEKDLADRARMSRAQAFFKMAEESAKPGGTFLKGATAGLSQYAEAKQALADKREQMQDLAKERQFALQEAREQLKLGDYRAARAAQKDADKRAEELADKQADYAQRMAELEFQAKTRRYEIEAQGAQRKEELTAAKTARETLERQLAAEPDPAKRAIILAQLRELAKLSPTYLAAEERYNSNPFGEVGMGQTGWSAQERK